MYTFNSCSAVEHFYVNGVWVHYKFIFVIYYSSKFFRQVYWSVPLVCLFVCLFVCHKRIFLLNGSISQTFFNIIWKISILRWSLFKFITIPSKIRSVSSKLKYVNGCSKVKLVIDVNIFYATCSNCYSCQRFILCQVNCTWRPTQRWPCLNS